MNTTLLRKVADGILATPEQYNQKLWVSSPGNWEMYDNSKHSIAEYADHDPHECGTACCIAGWAVCLSPREEVEKLVGPINPGETNYRVNDWVGVSRDLLGINSASLFGSDTDRRAFEVDEQGTPDLDRMFDDIRDDVEYNEYYDRSYTPADYIENGGYVGYIVFNPRTVAMLLHHIANLWDQGLEQQATDLTSRKSYRDEWMTQFEQHMQSDIAYKIERALDGELEADDFDDVEY